MLTFGGKYYFGPMKTAALYKLKQFSTRKNWKVNVKQCANIFVRFKPPKKVRKECLRFSPPMKKTYKLEMPLFYFLKIQSGALSGFFLNT